ncbi:hypothetical protein NPIL_683821 [Nephila pilipes]|uniref:Uncharacterized protein n=1 Tax=Nephila pilipes TaxID=299642 RepID=A0A8X6PG41_NEPPI|nr:hypothetical protein NPIL_683821 [Nephila pilipes]
MFFPNYQLLLAWLMSPKQGNNCPKVKKESKPERPPNSEVQICFVVQQKMLHVKDITLDEKTISTLINTGNSQILTKGSFEHDFVIDEDRYPLTWHALPVVPSSTNMRRDNIYKILTAERGK